MRTTLAVPFTAAFLAAFFMAGYGIVGEFWTAGTHREPIDVEITWRAGNSIRVGALCLDRDDAIAVVEGFAADPHASAWYALFQNPGSTCVMFTYPKDATVVEIASPPYRYGELLETGHVWKVELPRGVVAYVFLNDSAGPNPPTRGA